MPSEEKKGITVKIDAELHAQVKAFIEANGLTMAEFVSLALDHELHPAQQIGGNTMENMRTLAFQVPETLFQQIKDYLNRNHMTQKQFVLGLIQAEINRDLEQRQSAEVSQESSAEAVSQDTPEEDDLSEDEDFAGNTTDAEPDDEEESEDDEIEDDASEDESDDETFNMGM